MALTIDCHHCAIHSASKPERDGAPDQTSCTHATSTVPAVGAHAFAKTSTLSSSNTISAGTGYHSSSTAPGGLIVPVIALSISLGILLALLISLSLFLWIRRYYRQDNVLATSHSASAHDVKTLDPQISTDVVTGSKDADISLTGTPALIKGSGVQPSENAMYSSKTEYICRRVPASLTEARLSPPLEVTEESFLGSYSASGAAGEQPLHDAVSAEEISSGQDEMFHPDIHAHVMKNTLTKGALVHMQPMKPRKEAVMAGYNPKLDEKRPQEMKEYLSTYRILFVIDDSRSMRSHWDETRAALEEISGHALECYSNALEIRFFNSLSHHERIKGVVEINRIFNEVLPDGGTPTGNVLAHVLNKQIDRLDEALRSGRYSSEPPLNIIVLTDGVPDDDSQPAPVIDVAATRLRNSKHHANWISIQFVQIGDDPDAEPTLLSFIDGPNNDMVDTISYSFYKCEGGGRLTAAVLKRIILGGLHPNLRAYWNQYRQRKHQKTSEVLY